MLDEARAPHWLSSSSAQAPLRRRPALLAALALIAGIALERTAPGGAWPGTLAAIAGSLAGIAALAMRRGTTLLALMALILLSGAYARWRDTPASDDVSQRYPDGAAYAVLEGVVAAGTASSAHDPLAYEETGAVDRGAVSRQRSLHATGELPAVFHEFAPTRAFLLDLDSDAGTETSLSGRVKVYVDGPLELGAGENVRLTCRLEPPRPAMNPGEINLARLYADRGIRMLAYADGPERIARRGQTWRRPFQRMSESARRWVMERAGSRMGERPAMLLACLALGETGGLSPQLRQDFLRAGSVHVLVVSGLHVWVLCFVVLWLCGRLGLGRRTGALVGAGVALVFLVLTGGQVATLRAVIVVCLYAAAQWRGRPADFLNLLAASVLIVLAREPSDLFSAGFQLSYISVLALGVLLPLMRRHKRSDGEPRPGGPLWLWRYAADSAFASLAVTIATLPLVLAGWNLAAPVAALVNLVLAVPLAMTLGLALFLPLAIFDPAAAALASLLDAVLGLLDTVVHWAAALKGGHFYLAAPSTPWIVLFYAALTALPMAHRMGRWRVAPAMALVLLLALLPWWPSSGWKDPFSAPDGKPRLAFLDVRQGACAVLETRDGLAVFDAGSQRRPSVGSWTIAPFLFRRLPASGLARPRIAVLSLSHADADHVNGAAELVERFAVSELWIGTDFETQEQGRELLEWLTPRVDRVRRLRAGESITFGGVTMDVLWPDPTFAAAARGQTTPSNESSIVLRLDLGYASALIAGDAEDVAISGIGANLTHCDAVLAPHHGSDFAALEVFVERTRPREVVISAHEGFSPGHVQQIYAGEARVWRTYEHGALQLVPAADGYAMIPYRDGPR